MPENNFARFCSQFINILAFSVTIKTAKLPKVWKKRKVGSILCKWKTCITLSCNKLGHLSSEFLTIIFELIFYFKNYILGHNFDQDLVQVAMGIQERKKLKISVKTKDGKLFVGYVKSIWVMCWWELWGLQYIFSDCRPDLCSQSCSFCFPYIGKFCRFFWLLDCN